MLAVAWLLQPYQADVIKFACFCCLRCGRTARQKSCDGERDRCEGQPGWDVIHKPQAAISERNVFHVVFPFLGVVCWCVQIAQSCFSAPRRSATESRLSVFEQDSTREKRF